MFWAHLMHTELVTGLNIIIIIIIVFIDSLVYRNDFHTNSETSDFIF